MTTWGDMLSHVRAEIEESSASIWSDASLLRFLNEGAQDFARKTLCLDDTQEAYTVNAQNNYVLPDYTIDVTSVVFVEDDLAPLTRITHKDFLQNELVGETGDPYYYALHDGTLWLYPTPDSVTQMRFARYYAPDPITETTDTVPYSGEHEAAMRNYIKARAYEQIGDFTASDRFQMLYEREAEESGWETKRSRFADEPLTPQMRW